MSKRRIVLVVDEDTETIAGRHVVWQQRMATVETVEDIPEPNRVQEFRVRIESPADYDPWTRQDVEAQLEPIHNKANNKFTVTEVDPP